MFGRQGDQPTQDPVATNETAIEDLLSEPVNPALPPADTPAPAGNNFAVPPAPEPAPEPVTPAPAQPLQDVTTGTPTPVEPLFPTPAPTPAAPMPEPVVPTPTPATGEDLLGIKQQVLTQLSPLVGHLDQTPEEKFRTIMMMIQASDNQGLVQAAYEAAQAIPDEKVRAQALLDIVNEINYFTHNNA